ncbi:class I SAM-dependent methyltransferase [Streptomyces sp. NPDC006739]|uniref:class I SAM-dependent methyltransferase n=1 Tax=Streptomyces sp. NPDC006739 TaxID=3364763 RepID=UPI0036B607EB
MTTPTVRPDHAAVTYDATAPFYDILTQFDDYAAFSGILDGLIRRASPPGRRLLDAGCGNGRSSVLFAGLGYRVTGTDISPAMIETARRRHAGSGIDFHVHDVREPVAHGPYDVVLCMSDIVNYLLEPADLAEAFRSVAAALNPGGVLVFDANTPHGYDLMTSPHFIETDQAFVTLRGRHDVQGEAHRFRLAIDAFRTVPADRGHPDLWTRSTVEHLQAHHSPDRFARLLAAAGLRLVGSHGLHISGTVADSLDEKEHTKGLYVAVRESDG